eukprot:12373617-Ditylum_brightwellii.AAC.1
MMDLCGLNFEREINAKDKVIKKLQEKHTALELALENSEKAKEELTHGHTEEKEVTNKALEMKEKEMEETISLMKEKLTSEHTEEKEEMNK